MLPGFGLSLGFTLGYLSLLVLIPLSTLFVKSMGLGWAGSGPRPPHRGCLPPTGFHLSRPSPPRSSTPCSAFWWPGCWCVIAFPGAGCSMRWWICRSRCPQRLPESRSRRCTPNMAGWGVGWRPLGVRVAFTQLGIIVALTFIGLPFVVRTLQPVLLDLETEVEEAAVSLGATRWQTFRRVLLPALSPALLTGFALAFARAVGEYGSVVFISGNMPMKTEIAPLLIMTKLEQFDYAGATAIAVVMLVASFLLLLSINLLQWWSRRRDG